MTERLTPWVRAVGIAGVALMAGLVAVMLGRWSAASPLLALTGAIAVLALGLAVVEPAAIPLLAFPLLVIVSRLGVGGVDLSISDAALGAASLVAVVFAPRPFTPELRLLLWVSAFYQFATLFTVLNNPYTANIVEWVHTWMLISGSLLVGWVVGRSGHARVGMALLIAVMAVIALSTIAQGAQQFASGRFGPVYTDWPFSMHKNFVGTVSAIGATVAYARASWLRWSPPLSSALLVLFVLSLLLSQSRQAIIGLTAGILVLIYDAEATRRRSKLVLVLIVPALLFVSNMVQDQLSSDNEFNSVLQRITWMQDSVTVWQTDPWVGVGLRWWNSDRFGVRFQPPNAEVEVLTSAGVVGVVGFIILIAGTVVALRRVDPIFGRLALAVVAVRLVQAQFDLFWSAVGSSLPFLIAGLCIGTAAYSAHRAAGDLAVAKATARP